jgi:5-methylcytosine-specific restriction endonuclease McrA
MSQEWSLTVDNSKTCTKCGQTKALDCFSRHNGKKASKSGRRATCKSCDVEANKIYRAKNKSKVNDAKRRWSVENKASKSQSDSKYRDANKNKIKIRTAKWRLDNLETLKQKAKTYRTEHKEEKAAKDALYAKAKPEVNRAAVRRYRQNHPDRTSISGRRWRRRNPEYARQKSQSRRQWITSQRFIVTKKEMRHLYSMPCFYCGQQSEHVDHIVPLSRGGRHSIGNLTGACKACNLSKGARFITEWKKGRTWNTQN